MFPATAGINHNGKASLGIRPVRIAANTSPLAAMQWAKLPSPTTKAILQQSHHPDTTANVPGNCRHKPQRKSQPRNPSRENRGEHLSAGCDAVGEVAEPDDEGHTPAESPSRHHRKCSRQLPA